MAEYGLDFACSFVPEVPLMGEGSVLADLSEEDLKEAYLQAGLDFQVSKWMVLELHHQNLIQRAEHASAQRIQRCYREQKQRKQYKQNVAAKELRQQGKFLQEYLLQKVRNAEEHGHQQQQLLTAARQSCDQLEQRVRDQAQQLQEQQQHAAEESEVKSAQLAQQDAELAAAKQEVASCMEAQQHLERAAKNRSEQLQEQLTRRDTDLHDAKDQHFKLQKEFAGKCDEVTADKQERAALQKAHCASVKESEVKSAQLAQQDAELAAAKQEVATRLAAHQDFERAAKARSDQLQQQLAQRGTDLHAANKQLLKLQKEFADKCDEVTADKREQVALQRAHHASVKVVEDMSAQLQQQLIRKGADLSSAEQSLVHLQQELSQTQQSKHEACQELADWKRRTSDSEDALQKKVQDLEERLAAAASSQQSHRINHPSSHDNPDPPGVFKQPFSDEGTSRSDGGAGDMEAPAPPPGFGPIPSANTGGLEGAVQMRSFKAAYCGPKCRLPTVKQMVPRLGCIADELNDLHEAGLVHQAVHQKFVLVSPEGEWQLAEAYQAARMDCSLDKSMVYGGIEAPEMAQQLHKAGYYYPHPKQDMWAFGLLLYSVFKGKGQLPHEHEKAIRDGTTLVFATKLCGQARYTDWQDQIERTLKQGQVNLQLVKIVLGCLKKDPEERLTAAEVLAALYTFLHKKGW